MKIKYAVMIARTDNLGDNVQTRALYNIYKDMGIAEDRIVFLDIENVGEKIEAGVIYILPCVMVNIHYLQFIDHVSALGCDYQFRFIPLSIGYSRLYYFNAERLKALWKAAIDKMIRPIGFRDYDSAEMYRKIGYSGYVNGCITSTYPKRREGHYQKIYIIDIPRGFEEYIPSSIRDQAIRLSQIIDYHTPILEQYKLSQERYDLLRDTAALVITLRYHVATPCAAMGIPVVMIENYPSAVPCTCDPRLPALNPNIHYYRHEDWDKIDWHPQVAEFEEYKRCMVNLMVSRIENERCILEESENLESFYQPSRERFEEGFKRDRREYIYFSYYIDDLFLSKVQGNFKYYLFGLSNRYVERRECLILGYIRQFYPNAEFLGFVDSNKTGTYFGKKVIKPDMMQIDDDTYCLVSAYTANDFVTRLFEEKHYDKTHLWTMRKELLFYVYCL